MIDTSPVNRLYPILDTAALARRGCSLGVAAGALVDAGAGILQIRHKGHWSREFFGEAEGVAELCVRAGAQLVVNDRADFAMLLKAGLHGGQDDLPPAAARGLIGPGALLGFSTHNAEQLRNAILEPISYLALGPIFSTSSKDQPDKEVGLEKLREWRGIASQFPLVAIGGITRGNALSVLDAGADSVAVIGDLLPEECTELALSRRFEEWLRLLRE
jgi:thiamine-phosphate pyrophosphorylase